MSESSSMKVHVCVWDPKHTADISREQLNAVSDGTISKLADKYGAGSKEMKEALIKKKLITMVHKDDGELHCVECDSLMDELLAKPGVSDRHLAIEDIATNFSAAIERTRENR